MSDIRVFRGKFQSKSKPEWEGQEFVSPSDTNARYARNLDGELVLTYRTDGRPLPLNGLYKRKPVFLVCGGPSLPTFDLTKLTRRGLCSMCVNNSWLSHRPTFWVGVDPPGRFADIGWKDPGILKFVPRCNIGAKLSVFDVGDEKPRPSSMSVMNMPNVAVFDRINRFDPETFFTEPAVSWGNTKKEPPDAVGIRNSRSTMLSAIRLLDHMGFGTIYIVGADFHMPLDESLPAYGFGEHKWVGGRKSNNNMYKGLNKRLSSLREYIERSGHPLKIFNCTRPSGLTCFPHKPYEEAVEEASAECGKEVQTRGWYVDKDEKRRAKQGKNK